MVEINHLTKSILIPILAQLYRYLCSLWLHPRPISPADLMSYFALPCHLPLSFLGRYNSTLLWYFTGRTSSRELTNWQSDLIENTVNPTLAQAFNLTSSLTHGRPTNPVLNPKALLFCSHCATHCSKSPSDSVSSHPSPSPCLCICVWVCEYVSLSSGTAGIIIL